MNTPRKKALLATLSLLVLMPPSVGRAVECGDNTASGYIGFLLNNDDFEKFSDLKDKQVCVNLEEEKSQEKLPNTLEELGSIHAFPFLIGPQNDIARVYWPGNRSVGTVVVGTRSTPRVLQGVEACVREGNIQLFESDVITLEVKSHGGRFAFQSRYFEPVIDDGAECKRMSKNIPANQPMRFEVWEPRAHREEAKIFLKEKVGMAWATIEGGSISYEELMTADQVSIPIERPDPGSSTRVARMALNKARPNEITVLISRVAAP